VGLGRVELPARGLGNRCSIHLSYRPCPVHSSYTGSREFWVASSTARPVCRHHRRVLDFLTGSRSHAWMPGIKRAAGAITLKLEIENTVKPDIRIGEICMIFFLQEPVDAPALDYNRKETHDGDEGPFLAAPVNAGWGNPPFRK
jgi:hypothetical protein